MNAPTPMTFTFTMLARRWEKWGKSEADIEAYLRERSLHCFIQIGTVTLLDCSENLILLGGRFELSGYGYIKWDNGSCDLLKHPEVFLMRLSGHPEEKRHDWVRCGSRGSLRQYWRLNAYGHAAYHPTCSFIIRHEDLYFDLDEVLSFEDEHGLKTSPSPLSVTIPLRQLSPDAGKDLVKRLKDEGWDDVA